MEWRKAIMEEVGNRVKEGIVEKYNQVYGIIVTENGTKYEFIDRDVEGEKIKIGDHVLFFVEKRNYKINQENNSQLENTIARYVRKKNK